MPSCPWGLWIYTRHFDGIGPRGRVSSKKKGSWMLPRATQSLSSAQNCPCPPPIHCHHQLTGAKGDRSSCYLPVVASRSMWQQPDFQVPGKHPVLSKHKFQQHRETTGLGPNYESLGCDTWEALLSLPCIQFLLNMYKDNYSVVAYLIQKNPNMLYRTTYTVLLHPLIVTSGI